MGAIGLTEGQVGIGSTAYSALRAITLPPFTRNRIVHVTANSTTFPVKSLGHVPGTVSGTMLITGASVDEFVTAAHGATTETKFSFMWAGAEHYVYVSGGGDITALTCLNPYGTATRQYEVGFSFQLSRSKLYKSSDDSVVWGS